jgi:nucleoside-diphosphate-sugar epimerase
VPGWRRFQGAPTTLDGMDTVVVTGVSGLVGQRLLRMLDADETVRRVVGIDTRQPHFRPPKLEFFCVDLATAELKPLLDGAAALVHLAFAVEPAHDVRLLDRLNVGATRRLLEAAGAVGIRHVVYPSSAMVYGAWPDNPVPLTEAAVLRPNPGFVYAGQKAEVERLLAEWREGHPGVTVAVLRPAASPSAARESWLGRVWRGALPLRVRGASPPVQYLHEDDLAAAVALALRSRLDGVFNVAPDGWISGEEARALAPGVRLALPAGLVSKLYELGWASGLGDVPPAVLPYTVHPWVVANDRLRAAGWEPEHTSAEALVSASELPAWRAALGRHRQEVVLAATALGGIVAIGGAVGLLRWFGRRRRRASGPAQPPLAGRSPNRAAAVRAAPSRT